MKKFNILFALLLICFSAFSQAPTITSFSPNSGAVGTLVTIRGTNLSSPTAFTIGGVSAIVVSGSSDSIVGMVMPGAATGAVSVTTAGGMATSGSSFTITPTGYPSRQQGAKLVGTGAAEPANQGYSVALSADGNTAIIGGTEDSAVGAAWIFTRSGGVWIQQGAKLVGTGAVGNADQGTSVALSADGNTAIIGGSYDSSQTGAAWIFTRSGGTWSQQGSKLVDTAAGQASQGTSVALSADGNTAVVGGYTGICIYTRSGSTWTQQGSILVGTGAVGVAYQGVSVALSADGNTVIEGGPGDRSDTGAAWIFTRSGSNWTQQGSKLVGTGYIGPASQGYSIALSADGNTALVGGKFDNNHAGAAWIFTRTGSTWAQQGSKLVATGVTGDLVLGTSVALSADGNTAVMGGPAGNNDTGAVWTFTRSGSNWAQQSSTLVGAGAIGLPAFGVSIGLSADGNTAIVGGYVDNSEIGAAWVFVDSNSCNPAFTSINYSICSGDTFIFNGSRYSSTGVYFDTLARAGGCDSIVSLSLTVKPLNYDTIYRTICSGDTFVLGNQHLTVQGSYIDTFTNAGGCDSIVALTLTVISYQSSSYSYSICSGSSYFFGGHTLTASGVYLDTLTSSIGCDSIVTLTLSVSNVLTTFHSHSICWGSNYIFGGQNLSNTGIYTDTLTSNGGCDSIVTLSLTVDTLTAYFTLIPTNTPHVWDIVNQCSGPDLSYSWSWGDGSSNSTGDTASHIYSTAGYYTVCVQVTDTIGCVASYCNTNVFLFKDQSGQMVYVNVVNYPSGINQITNSPIHLYPNPNKGSFTLQTSGSIGSDYTISDMLGHIIMQQSIRTDTETIELPDAADGVYTLAVSGQQPIRFVVVR